MSTEPTPIRAVPAERVSALNEAPVNPNGGYVLYWMTAQRRVRANFSLQRALTWGQELGRPVLIFEPLRVAYPWASERFHAFVIDGMRDNAERCEALGVTYYPYVEREAGEGRGLLKALASEACVVVADEYPCYFLPKMLRSAARQLEVRLEQVDSCGILPLRASPSTFTTAASFRRHLQKTILPHLLAERFPHTDPLQLAVDHASEAFDPRGAVIPDEVREGWPSLDDRPVELSTLPIDHEVKACETGGSTQAGKVLARFLSRGLQRYHVGRNDVDHSAASGLSPYLHFGQISAHEVVEAALRSCDWDPSRVAVKPSGSRAGWWGASPAVESFLDEQITWREVGFVFAFHNPERYDQYESLPDWAQTTLQAHSGDERPYLYSLEELESGQTHDELWNAAQRQLCLEGKIHNYVRMLWGKKILEWSPSPQEALARLIHLNNKYALDGRDPNSYSGIFWCLGRFDRAWGPERPIFGKIRFMSSDSTKRKLKTKNYVARYQARLL